MYRTTEGKIALMLFKSLESAQAFINGKGQATEWKVEERSPAETAEWLRDSFRRYGASDLAVDPDPETSQNDASVIPIFTILVELEAEDS
jgi:hypothetical protein